MVTQTGLQIGIAGAGIMGRLLAWQLQRAGHQVSLFDKDPADFGGAAAYTAAGMLAPYSELESAESLIYQLGQRGLSLWPELVASLDAEDCFFQRGSLVVAHQQDQADLQRFNLTLQRKIPDDSSVRLLNQTALADCEPDLATQFQQATQLADEGWLYPREIMRKLAEQLMAGGASWYANTAIEKIGPQQLHTVDQQFHFDLVIDCRGLGAKQDIEKLRGVRGELLWVHAPEVTISRMVRLMHPRYRLYLVPQKDQQYILGATQIESDDNSAISVRSALELLSALYAIHPGFAEARITETKTNCRPALMDNLPLISTADGLIRVNGLFRHGWLLAPALVEEVLRYVQTQTIAESQFPSIYNEGRVS